MHWYAKDGLQFSCTGCGYCCGVEPGYVFLSKNDVTQLSAVLGITEEQCMNLYCRKIDMGSFYMVSLLEKEGNSCIFLEKQGCSVYQGRPSQCKTYPFWEQVVDSEESWKREEKYCPGIGQGKVYHEKEISALLKIRLNEPLLMLPKVR